MRVGTNEVAKFRRSEIYWPQRGSSGAAAGQQWRILRLTGLDNRGIGDDDDSMNST